MLEQARTQACPADRDLPLFRNVRDVLIVASSSRSGSTAFAELFRRSRRYLYLPGEINPFLRLAGLAWPQSGTDSDALTCEHRTPAALSRLETLMLAEVGFESAEAHAELGEAFVATLHRQLLRQWPLEPIRVESVRNAVHQAVRAHGGFRWQADADGLPLHIIMKLREIHPAINPYYYDVDRHLIARLHPQIPLPSGPPSPQLLEEPPFVLPRPWHRWVPEDLERRTLVLKAPSNAYRLPFLVRLFPRARVRVIHLTRNPAAAINGLYDGWQHWGFHSHFLGDALDLSLHSPRSQGDRGWWKFDLPPGWRHYANASLELVCGFQWAAAHDAIVEFLTTSGVDSHRIRFEDVASRFAEAGHALATFREWLGDPGFFANDSPLDRAVMATHPPRPDRWRQRSALLAPVLAHEPLRRCTSLLGYEDMNSWR